MKKEVAEFVRQLRARSLPVTSDCIHIKAVEVIRASGHSREQFKGTASWTRRFMKRKGFALRRRISTCQKLPEENERKLTDSQQYVIKLRQKCPYMLGEIGNADETPVWFDMPSNCTVSEKGAKQVKPLTRRNEHPHFTVMLACTADGRKLPPFIISKRKTLPKEDFPRDVIVRVNKKGFMNASLMLEWIRLVWNRQPGALFG